VFGFGKDPFGTDRLCVTGGWGERRARRARAVVLPAGGDPNGWARHDAAEQVLPSTLAA
jgi:hypothetical protein